MNQTAIFLQSYVNFPTLNKVLLTDSINFASKRKFLSFPSFGFQYKGQNRKLGNLGNFQLPPKKKKNLEISAWKPPQFSVLLQ